MAAPPSSRRILVIAVGAVLLTGAAIGWKLAGTADEPSSDSPSSGASVSAPTTAPQSTATGGSAPPSSPLSEEEATDLATSMLKAVAEGLADPSTAADDDPSSLMSGFQLDEYRALAAQYADEGLHQEGTAVLEDPRIVDVADDGSTLVLEACVDSSGVTIVNDAGRDVSTGGSLVRARTLFTFVLEDGAWKLEKQGFTDDPTC